MQNVIKTILSKMSISARVNGNKVVALYDDTTYIFNWYMVSRDIVITCSMYNKFNGAKYSTERKGLDNNSLISFIEDVIYKTNILSNKNITKLRDVLILKGYEDEISVVSDNKNVYCAEVMHFGSNKQYLKYLDKDILEISDGILTITKIILK